MEPWFGRLCIPSGNPQAIAKVFFLINVEFEAEFISVGPCDNSELSEFQKGLGTAYCETKNETVSRTAIENCGRKEFLNFSWCGWEIR